MTSTDIQSSYDQARVQYQNIGVDTDEALRILKTIRISIPCWQGDDVKGFENTRESNAGGGIQATGHHPGRARNMSELMQDLQTVLTLVPGNHRVNLHAMYGNFGSGGVDRHQIELKHFQEWIDWAGTLGIGLDFNATCFDHPKAADGFTLSSQDQKTREFWIEHVKRCRRIAAEMGRQLGSPCIHNLWIPDGSKDMPVDRKSRRDLLRKSLDEIFAETHPSDHLKDAIESKLFGIGLESMTVGSHEFYLAYAVRNRKMLCIDNGHFHPTEQAGDKISSCLEFTEELLLHITRPVRWDSDHVPILNDNLIMMAQEIVRSQALDRIHIGLDFFDASMNRIGAWVLGIRAVQQALLMALLEPHEKLRIFEINNRYFERLAWLEILKSMPFGAVWDYWCMRDGVPVGPAFIDAVLQYEKEVQSKRN